MPDKPLQGLKVLMLLDNSFQSDARVEKEAKSIVNHGGELIVLCVKSQELPKNESRDGYQIHRKLESGYNAPLRKGYKNYIDNCVNLVHTYDFDLLHCHDFYMLSIGTAYKLRYQETKLIYDAHEFLSGWPFYKSSNGLNKWKGLLVWKKLVQKEKKESRSADLVITITEGIAKRLQERNSLSQKPEVVGNYPIQSPLVKPDKYFHRLYDLDDDMQLIVHSGTIYHSDEEIEELMKAIVSFDKLAIVFMGNRPRFDEVRRNIESNENWNKRAYFHDYIHNQNEMINTMSAATIGLLHINKKWEAHEIGFSNRFVEYVMAELPVIGTPQEFTEEFNKKYDCCSFYKGSNSNEIKASIQSLLNDFKFKKSNAFKGKSSLNWDSEEKKLVHLYSKLRNE